MQFDVRALNADATVSQLSVDALDEADARRQVESRGLFVAAVILAALARRAVTR